MSGNSQQENTLRKREKERAGEREERREREGAGFIKSLDNKLAPSDGWWKDTGSEARGPRRGRIRQRGERQRKREKREHYL